MTTARDAAGSGSGGPTLDAATIGARVRAARLARGVSLRGLARLLQLSPATLSQIENGRTTLSVERLGRIAEILDAGVPEILRGDVGAGGVGDGGARADGGAGARGARAARPAAGLGGEPGAVAPSGRDTAGAGAGPSGAGGPDTPAGGEGADGAAAPGGLRLAPGPSYPDWRSYGPLDFDPVLRAALDEILAIGYHGATVRSIAARAGLSVAGMYHHYTSKQQMLVKILDLTMSELLLRALAARDEGGGPVVRFRLLVEHLALFHTHRRELGFVGAAEMRSLDPHHHRRIAGLRTTMQRMVDREVEAAVRAGLFRVDHPREAARAAVTLCTALPTWWQPGGLLTPEQVALQYVGFALDLVRYDDGAR